jgi:hypothetical protein
MFEPDPPEHSAVGQLREQPVDRLVESELAFLDEHHDRSRGHRLGHRGNSEDCVAAHVRTFERHLAEHERLDFGSAGDEANHARRKARFNVAFQSSAKLSKTRGGESPRFFPGAACDEKRRKCAPLASRVRRSISCRPSCRCIVCLLVSGNREIDDFMTVPRSRPG